MSVQVGTFCVRTRFLVVPNLAIPCILGTAYTNRYVKTIRCRERMVELLDGSQVAIKAVHGEPPGGTPPEPEEQETVRPSTKIRVARGIRIPAMSEQKCGSRDECQG